MSFNCRDDVIVGGSVTNDEHEYILPIENSYGIAVFDRPGGLKLTKISRRFNCSLERLVTVRPVGDGGRTIVGLNLLQQPVIWMH